MHPTEGALILHEVRSTLLKQISDRFAAVSVIDSLGWLKVDTWPAKLPPSFAETCLQPVYKHWEERLQQWSISYDALLVEFKAMVTVAESMGRPKESSIFLETNHFQPK
jgi:hypothetical protein